eukprot:6474722-Amphidinium_carterae.2
MRKVDRKEPQRPSEQLSEGTVDGKELWSWQDQDNCPRWIGCPAGMNQLHRFARLLTEMEIQIPDATTAMVSTLSKEAQQSSTPCDRTALQRAGCKML